MSAMIKLFLDPLKKWAYSDFMQETAKTKQGVHWLG